MHRIGPQPGHFGAWRVLCAVPAVLASSCLVTILFSGLGRRTSPAVLGWLLTGPLLLLGPAERVAVRAFCRFRSPTSTEIEWLTPLRTWTERRCGAGPGRFVWYVSDDPGTGRAGRRPALDRGQFRLSAAGRPRGADRGGGRGGAAA